MQTERVGVVWKSYKLIFATCLSRISAKSSASLLASLSFFVVLLNCSRQIPGYNRFVPNHFLSIVLKSFKDEKSESNYLYKYVSIQVLIYTMLPDFQENIASWKVPRLRPFVIVIEVFSVTPQWRSDTDSGKPN